ncbi:flagellar protein FlgN [Desulfoscipio gibsoniae]|uniref:Small-conductance mechanosensitive channel n=1 Tax=Desulfoscipio gibsoniae DSM 7213 TaxID=767817 RepID=R4KJA3_9FIRM|nr:flagellar protein FlgN [Desulfoscipio gibsoniae]AGL01702.1 small-conductance mechanosensitive channel [Desulfoscipio gibsoniae DSM 7213]
MEPLFNELVKILNEQCSVVQKQLKASEAQNQALRDLDMQLLNQAVQQLEQQSITMKELDKQRETIQQQLGATVSDILPKAPFEIQLKLKEIQRQLKGDFQRISQLNEINKVLTMRAAQVNEVILNIFKTGGSSSTYRDSGAIQQKGRPAGILNKTV